MAGIFAYAFNTVATANIHIKLSFSMWILVSPAELFQQINRHYAFAFNLFVKLFLISATCLMTQFILSARYKLHLVVRKNVCIGLTLRNQ